MVECRSTATNLPETQLRIIAGMVAVSTVNAVSNYVRRRDSAPAFSLLPACHGELSLAFSARNIVNDPFGCHA